jgi:hypothetical protein
MAKKYVSRCHVLANGQRLQHLKNFKWSDRKYREQIKTMDGVGTVDTIPDQTFALDYVIPTASPKLDWSNILDYSFVVLLKSGQRVVFTGVDAMSDGEMALDGEKESVMTIMFGYQDATIE